MNNIEEKIKAFVAKLDTLCETMKDDEKDSSCYLTDGFEDDHQPLVREIVGLACEIFISKQGQTQYTTYVDRFSNGKYCIVCGEKDSFLDIVTARGRIRIMEL